MAMRSSFDSSLSYRPYHTSVYTKSASRMASSRLSVTVTLPPDSSQFLRPMASRSSRIWCPSGPYCTKSMPIFEQMNISDTHTCVASPTNTILQFSMRLPSGRCSIMVRRSPISCVGWL